MNNKERFIKAVRDTRESSVTFDYCLLCQVAGRNSELQVCTPCQFAGDDGDDNCSNAAHILSWPTNKKEKDRAGYYKRMVIKILEETPAKYFEERTWRFNKKLHSYIDKQHEKIKEEE